MSILPTARRLIFPLIATVLFSAVAVHADPAQLLHRHAPRFVRTSLDGRRVDLAAYRGKVVLLTFWATWCTPCQAEMPRFVDWQSRYASQGLQIVAVSMDDDTDAPRAAIAKQPVNYPVVMGDVRVGRAYGSVLGLPVNFLIDRRGRVSAVIKGEPDLDAMETKLQDLLKSQ